MIKKLLSVFVCCLLFISTATLAVVNLNTATQEELETIKGIGPAKSQAIIEYRKQHGPFKTIDDLLNVKGFGNKTVDAMRQEISVGSPETPSTITDVPKETVHNSAKETTGGSEKETVDSSQKSADKTK